MYVETFIRFASVLDVSLDILADMGKMGRQQRAQMEAFYMISHGKARRKYSMRQRRSGQCSG